MIAHDLEGRARDNEATHEGNVCGKVVTHGNGE